MTDKTQAPELKRKKDMATMACLEICARGEQTASKHLVQGAIDMIRELREARTDACAEVKPLVWRNSYGVMRADTPLGTWFIKGAIAEFRSMDFSMAPGGDIQRSVQQKHDDRSLQVVATRPASEVRQQAHAAGYAQALKELLVQMRKLNAHKGQTDIIGQAYNDAISDVHTQIRALNKEAGE